MSRLHDHKTGKVKEEERIRKLKEAKNHEATMFQALSEQFPEEP